MRNTKYVVCEQKKSYLSGFTKFLVRRTGILNYPLPKHGAHLEVDRDLSPLFPYIKSVVSGAQYFNGPERIQFVFEGIQCTIYAYEIIAAAFNDHDHARSFAENLLHFLNHLHEKKNTIEPDYRMVKPISPLEVYKVLPKSNCGECGMPSCLAFAGALSRGTASISQCPRAAKPMEAKAVYPIVDEKGRMINTVELDMLPELPQMKEKRDDLMSILTARELEVLRLLAGGLSNPQISEQLFISPHTVKTHVAHVYEKLGVKDRAQAAVLAARYHLI